jgi:MFS family permease
MFVAVLAPTPAVAIAAYAILGLGVAVIVPIMFTLAGNTQGARPEWAMGRFTMMGYSGLFAGPPVIGFVAHRCGLGLALSVPAVLLASIVPLAFALKRRQHQVGEPRVQLARASN